MSDEKYREVGLRFDERAWEMVERCGKICGTDSVSDVVLRAMVLLESVCASHECGSDATIRVQWNDGKPLAESPPVMR